MGTRASAAGTAESERPEETGWRTTPQNINLNRDYTKADAPEKCAALWG